MGPHLIAADCSPKGLERFSIQCDQWHLVNDQHSISIASKVSERFKDNKISTNKGVAIVRKQKRKPQDDKWVST